MAINTNSAGSGRGVDHGSGASVDNLTAADLIFHIWTNDTATGGNQSLITKAAAFLNGWIWSVDANGTVLLVVGCATTNANFTSANGVVDTGVDTFLAAGWDAATKTAKLWKGTRTQAPVEVAYSTQTAGVGSLNSDAAGKVYVGNIEFAPTNPFLGHIQQGGIIAATATPALILDIWRSTYNTNKARTGCKLAFDYTDNTTLTDGSGNGNNGTLLASAPTGTTVNLPSVTAKAVTEANIHFSPYNWYSDGGGALAANNIKGSSTYALSPNPGAYFKTKVVVGALGSINLEVDPTIFSGLTATQTPLVSWLITGTAGRSSSSRVIGLNDPSVPMASGLASGTYAVEVWFSSLNYNTTDDRFTTPKRALKVLSLIIDSDGSLSAPTVASKNVLAFGDSIFEAANVIGTGLLTSDSDAEQSAAITAGKALGAEVGLIAYGGAGWVRGIGNVVPSTSAPGLYNSDSTKRFYDFYAAGKSRLVSSLYSPVPDYILIEMGINDSSLTAQQVTDAIDAIRTAAGSSAWIFVNPGPGATDAVWTTVTSGVAAAAQTTRTQMLEVSRTITPSTAGRYTTDGGAGSQHPNSRGHARWASDMLSGIVSAGALGSAVGYRASQRSA